jgi:RHS repeat-associated protein
VVADTTGDGLYEILFPVTSTHTVSVLPHQGTTITPDLATSFTDGFGINYSPSYAQLTNSTFYTKGSGAAFPEQDTQTPLTVASQYSASDGIAGTYSVTEHYNQARQNLQRRQFESFGSLQTVDSRDLLYRKTFFAQLDSTTLIPLGLVTEQYVKQSDNTTYISDVVNTVAVATLDPTNKRYFPYVSQSIASTYEFAGALNGTLITQKTIAVTYGGTNGFAYGNPSKITTTTVDKDPNSPWPSATFVDTLNMTPYEVGGTSSTGWCIHLSSQASEQRTQPGGATLTHTTAYGVNANSKCEVDSRSVEASSSVDKVVTTYGYDGCGNINSTSLTGLNPDGSAMAARTTTQSFGLHCIYPETVTNPLSQPSTFGYRYDLGLPTSSTDPNGLQTSWTYNDIGQKTLEQRPDGTQTSYALSPCSSGCVPIKYYLTTSEQDSTAGHATFRQLFDAYDQLDRVMTHAIQTSTGSWVSVLQSYDSLGRLAQRSSPYISGASTYYTTYTYDVLNRTTSMSRPISSTNPTLEYTNYTYQGRKSAIQDPKGYTTTNQTDVIGELGIVTDPDGVSKTNYGYDPFSNLTSIKDPANNQTTRTFDALGYLLTNTSDPDRGTWTLQYDSLGELRNLRDAKTASPNWTQQLTYDALSRLTQRVESEGTTTWTWGTVAANHEIGRLKQVAGPGDTDTNTYDSAGRLASRSMFNGITYSVGYSYNNIGKLSVLTYPLAAGQSNPFAVLYGYTTGYLSSLQNYTGGVAGTTFWQLTSGVTNMDAWGHAVDETLGTTTAVRIQSAFDGVTGWMNTRTVGSGGSLNNIQNLAYQWDLNGNLGQRQDVIQALTEVFNYDNLNRIQTSTLNGTQNLSVATDSTGNITSRTEGGITYGYTYDTTHKHAVDTVGTSPHQTTYTYDANGNMATRNGLNVIWASYNLPTAINGSGGVSSAFTYGPDRRVIQQSATYVADGDSGTETTTYVFGLYEYEITPAQNHNKYFVQVPAGTQIIYDIQSVSGAQTTYITADHLGSGNIFLNSAGTKLINESFSAYGYRRSSNWSGALSSSSSDYTTIASTTRRGYTDAFHEVLDNLDLIHMNGRVYDPVIGRFMSPDPIVTKVGDSQRGNPYSYVSNRPLTLTDPTGLQQSVQKKCPPGIQGCNSGAGGWGSASFGQPSYFIAGPMFGQNGLHASSGTGATFDTAAAAAGNAINAAIDQSLGDIGTSLRVDNALYGSTSGGVGSGNGGVDFMGAMDSMANAGLLSQTPRPPVWDPPGPSGGFFVDDLVGTALTAGASGLGCNGGCAVAAGLLLSAVSPALGRSLIADDALALRFAQTTASPFFSSEGAFAGQSIADVAGAIRAGTLTTADVPVQFVTIDGSNLLVNTRSSLALMQAGVPTSQWALVDMTGDAATQALINQRLLSNGLSSSGSDVLRITGSGPNASTLIPGP